MSGLRDESLCLGDMIDAVTRLIELGAELPPGYAGEQRSMNEQILWNLVVLGEACKRVNAATQQRYSNVAWSEVSRTRDRVIHHYEGIDWFVVAKIIELDLPHLLPRLTQVRDTIRAEFDAADGVSG